MAIGAKEYNALTYNQMQALDHLDFAVPMHQTTMRTKWGIPVTVLNRLQKLGYARITYYHERTRSGEIMSYGVPFWTLTQRGATLKRNYWR